jgi:hypothetical protein
MAKKKNHWERKKILKLELGAGKGNIPASPRECLWNWQEINDAHLCQRQSMLLMHISRMIILPNCMTASIHNVMNMLTALCLHLASPSGHFEGVRKF